MRQVNIQSLSKALQQLRGHSLNSFECYLSAGKLTLPLKSGLNPPVWELGHIAWFQEYWIGRNQQRSEGLACDHSHQRKASLLRNTDLWFDSAKVPHATRWELDLPTPKQCATYAKQVLTQTLGLLQKETHNSKALYFYWLALQHEAMHLEASAYMAQALKIPYKAQWQTETATVTHKAFNTTLNAGNDRTSGPNCQQRNIKYKIAQVGAQTWLLGSNDSNLDLNEKSFCFDNELTEKICLIKNFEISLRPVDWAQYLDFVNATGYHFPNYIRKKGMDFEVEVFGSWVPLNKHAPAVHLSWTDAQNYCTWAKCRLPTEAEWDCAAKTLTDFEWGHVWEWTQDTFNPYEGFVAHPYSEYSEPWFGTHKVLRGASHLTHSVLRHVNYRNFFTPDRDDIYSGFRTCAI